MTRVIINDFINRINDLRPALAVCHLLPLLSRTRNSLQYECNFEVTQIADTVTIHASRVTIFVMTQMTHMMTQMTQGQYAP